MEIVILAGGQGKRLRPLTHDIPKCMVPVNGNPMLQYHVDWLRKYSPSKIVVACGYKWEHIKKHYGNTLTYSVEEEPLGTGGAIRQAIEHLEGENFFVLNADDINNVNLHEFEKSGANSIAISRFHSQFGIVETDNGLIKNFKQKPLLPYWANMGLYLFNRKLRFPERGNFETEMLPKLAEKNELKAFRHEGYWITINTMKELEEASKILGNIKS